MLNQFVIVGKIVKTESENNNTNIVVAVPRPYKNDNEEYESDMISCVLFGEIAKNTKAYCKEDDTIGSKERIQTNEGNMILIAEKVTFLSSKSSE